jgi:hypothetical protein
LSDTELGHVYRFTNGLIDRMDVKEGEEPVGGAGTWGRSSLE